MSSSTATPTLSPPSQVGLLREAVQHHRSVSIRGLLERCFARWFRGLVYNQIWEDPHVDVEALRLNETSRVVTIASGGCNVLNYLTCDPVRVVALDLNPAHLALTRLKMAALKHLPNHDAFYDFFGHGDRAANVDRYHRYLRAHLDPATRRFWERRVPPLGRPRVCLFREGFYRHGRLSRLVGLVHALARVRGTHPERLLAARSVREQERIFEETVAPLFRSRFIRWASRLPVTVFSLGIPPQQHRAMEAETHNLAMLYLARLRRLACAFPIADNYFAWQVFGRRYDHVQRRALPDYLRRACYERLRARIGRVETHLTSYAAYLADQPPNALDAFVLLDAQDWMPSAKIAALWREIARVGAPGARIIFRTAGTASPVESALPEQLRARFAYERTASEALHTRDRSAIYGMFHCYVLER